MRLRTDDDIYRARLVYLGPPGYTLPIHLPYAQYWDVHPACSFIHVHPLPGHVRLRPAMILTATVLTLGSLAICVLVV